MNPLLVSYEWPGVTTNCGGGGRVAQNLVDGLQSLGHDALVQTDRSDGHYLTFPVRQYRAIKRCIRRNEPDILHGQFSIPSSVPLARCAGQLDVPFVVTVMGSDIHNPQRFTGVRPLLNRANRWVLDRADRVYAPSADLCERTAELTETEVRLIPHGIATEPFEWRDRELHDPVRVLTVARLAPGKNIDVAIKAVDRLRSDTDAVHRIVGEGSQSEIVERRDQNTEWLEWVGWAEDVQPHYDWADVFLLPSAWEAFGLVYCEALASGLPVVATMNGGPADIVTGGVGRLASATPGAQADALRTIIDDYETFQEATEDFVETHYSQERMAHNYHQEYRKLC